MTTPIHSELLHACATLLLDAAVKGILVLALAAVAQLAWRRASAAERHAVWLLALVLAFLWPIASALDRSGLSQPSANGSRTGAGPDVTMEVTAGPNRGSVGVPLAHQGNESRGTRLRLDHDWALPIAWVWLAGLGFVLVRWAVNSLRLVGLRRRARDLQDQTWARGLSATARLLAIARPVRLLESADVTVPITCGSWRPLILLPESAQLWSPERRHLVLMHELGHIVRWDCLTQTIAEGICAVAWFNPLAWLAARRMRLEREFACDDLVLRSGQKPSDYASHLVDLAEGVRCGSGLVPGAIAMAAPSQLEARIAAIVSASTVRWRPRRWIISCFAVAGLVVTMLAPHPMVTGFLLAQDARSAALAAQPHPPRQSTIQDVEQIRTLLEAQVKEITHIQGEVAEFARGQLPDSDPESGGETAPHSDQTRGTASLLLNMRIQISRLDSLAGVLESLESNPSTGLLMTLLPKDSLLQHLLIRKMDAELELDAARASNASTDPAVMGAAGALKSLTDRVEAHLRGIAHGMRTKQRALEAELTKALEDGSNVEVEEHTRGQGNRGYFELKRKLANLELMLDVLSRRLASRDP